MEPRLTADRAPLQALHRWLPWAAGAAALTSFALLRGPPVAIGDALRDQLLARDCLELGRCHTLGAATTVRGIYQGGLWPAFIAGLGVLGGGPAALQGVVLLGQSLSVTLVWAWAWRWVGPRAAPPAALLLTAMLVALGGAETLWNHSLVPPFATLTLVASQACGGRGGAPMAGAAGVSIGLGLASHPECITLVPAWLVAAAQHPRAPWTSLGLTLGAAGTALLLTAHAALTVNLAALPPGVVLASVAGGGGTFLAGLALRRRVGAWPPSRQALALAGLALATFAVGGAGLAVRRGTTEALAHYGSPVAPAIALLSGAALARIPGALLRTGLALGLALWVGSRHPSDPGLRFALTDAVTLSRAPALAGQTWEALKLGVQGPRCHEVVSLLAVAMPAPVGPADASPIAPVLVLGGPVGGFEGMGPLFPLSAGGAALVTPVATALDLRRLRVCLVDADGERCAPAGPDARELLAPEEFLFARRSYPETHRLAARRPYRIRWEYPLRTTHTPQHVTLAHASDRCGWAISGTPGRSVATALPADEVVLPPGDGGTLHLERQIHVDCPASAEQRFPPCIVETAANEGAIRALLRELR